MEEKKQIRVRDKKADDVMLIATAIVRGAMEIASQMGVGGYENPERDAAEIVRKVVHELYKNG